MRAYLILSAATLCLVSASASAFQLSPYGKVNNGAYTRVFSEAVHENLTLASIRQAAIPDALKADQNFIESLIAGARWNDDPLGFMKTGVPVDFYLSFKDSCKRSTQINPTWDLMYRTHCGDMQYLHAMASSALETTTQTRARIMMWAEFTFRVSTGEIPKNRYFRSVPQLMSPEGGEQFSQSLTHSNTRRLLWQPEDLFSSNCTRMPALKAMLRGHGWTESRCDDSHNEHAASTIQNLALGSLLHLLQDSFSDSHVRRFPLHDEHVSRLAGVQGVEQFGNYAKQDSSRHKVADRLPETANDVQPLDLKHLSAQLIALSVTGRDGTGAAQWEQARPLLEHAFDISRAQPVSGAIGYEKLDR